MSSHLIAFGSDANNPALPCPPCATSSMETMLHHHASFSPHPLLLALLLSSVMHSDSLHTVVTDLICGGDGYRFRWSCDFRVVVWY